VETVVAVDNVSVLDSVWLGGTAAESDIDVDRESVLDVLATEVGVVGVCVSGTTAESDVGEEPVLDVLSTAIDVVDV
jgi:hypothetical protein